MAHPSLAKQLLTRRTLIKTAGALAAGIAAPALWRVGEAFAAYPDRPIQDRRRQYARRAVRHHRANHGGGNDRDHRRLGDRGEQRRRRRQYRHGPGGPRGTRRLHDPALDQRLFGQSRALSEPAVRPVQGFRRDLRTCGVAARLRRQARPRRQHHEGIRRAGEEEPGQVQRLDPADRHHAATAGRGAQVARGAAGHGDGGVPGRRRCAQGTAHRHRATVLGRARARASADQGRQHQGARGDRRRRAGTICPTFRRCWNPATRTSCSTPIRR